MLHIFYAEFACRRFCSSDCRADGQLLEWTIALRTAVTSCLSCRNRCPNCHSCENERHDPHSRAKEMGPHLTAPTSFSHACSQGWISSWRCGRRPFFGSGDCPAKHPVGLNLEVRTERSIHTGPKTQSPWRRSPNSAHSVLASQRGGRPNEKSRASERSPCAATKEGPTRRPDRGIRTRRE